MQILANAVNFNIYLLLSTIFFLIFSGSSNFYYLNYQANLVLFFSFLIFVYNFFKSRLPINLNYIDYFFIADFIYNFIAIFYSRQPRASIEENIYQMTYIMVYLVVRCFSIYNSWETIIDYLKAKYFISLIFISQLYYIVFYKFELISEDGRISRGSTHPNLLASLILIFLAVILFFIIKAMFEKDYKSAAANSCIFIINAAIIILTSSRGGMLGLFLGVCAVFFFTYLNSGKKIKAGHFILITMAGLLTIYFLLPNHFERIQGLFSRQTFESLGSRAEIWTNCFKLFLKNPLLGVGPAGSVYAILEIAPYSMIDAHNFLLEKLCNIGLIGTFLYLLPLILIAVKIVKSLKNTNLSSDYRLTALNYGVLFMLVSVFTNSSFSPHYVIPAISMLIYSILAIYVSRTSGVEMLDIACLKSYKLNLFIIFFFSLSLAPLKNLIFSNFTNDFLNELFAWHFLTISFFISYLLCFHNAPARQHAGVENPSTITTSINNPYLLKIFASLLIIFTFYGYKGMYYYAAERANEAGIGKTFSFSSKNALKYFDIAINNDPGNIAYLLNKSYMLVISEFVKGSKFTNNNNIIEAADLLKEIQKVFKFDIHSKTNLSLIEAKLKGISPELISFPERGVNDSSVQSTYLNAGADEDFIESSLNTLLLDPAFSLAKVSDLYSKNALKIYININNYLRTDIDKISLTAHGKSKEIELNKYFPYITISYKAALNYDIHKADKILESGVSSAIQSVKYASKYIPVKGFEEKSIQYRQQFEILSTVAFLLPAIWKHGQNLEYEAVKANFYKFMGANNPLFTIIDHFLYGNELNLALFDNDETLKNYLINLKAFSDKNYDLAIANLNNVFKSPNKQLNAALYSWIYFKAGKLTEARDLVFYSHLGTLKPFKRDFIYKRNILFGGNFTPFYYIPLQTYFNEFIMLALIKMHNGDHTMVLNEIFDYLNTVIYNR